jgi:hypothetical protein
LRLSGFQARRRSPRLVDRVAARGAEAVASLRRIPTTGTSSCQLAAATRAEPGAIPISESAGGTGGTHGKSGRRPARLCPDPPGQRIRRAYRHMAPSNRGRSPDPRAPESGRGSREACAIACISAGECSPAFDGHPGDRRADTVALHGPDLGGAGELLAPDRHGQDPVLQGADGIGVRGRRRAGTRPPSGWSSTPCRPPRRQRCTCRGRRCRSLTIDHGWREVADTALGFVQRFAAP